MANNNAVTPVSTEEMLARIARQRKIDDSLWGAGVGSAIGGLLGLVFGKSGSGGAKLGAVIGAIAPHYSDKARNVARRAERHVAEVLCGRDPGETR